MLFGNFSNFGNGKIWEVGKILEDQESFGKAREDLGRHGKIWEVGKIWED